MFPVGVRNLMGSMIISANLLEMKDLTVFVLMNFARRSPPPRPAVPCAIGELECWMPSGFIAPDHSIYPQ
jgi:hypothetical protein